jgi:5-methylcytosine-specific restriction protein A
MTERLRGRAGQAQRKRRLQRTNGLCEDCLEEGRVTVAIVVNHKIPLIHGGSDDDENTENLCGPHDKQATAKQFGFKQKPEIGRDGWSVAPIAIKTERD